jgi:hypothetical protein
MTIYILTGFALAGLGQPSFLIPYFVAKGTNDVFAQNLNDEYCIRACTHKIVIVP